MDSKEIKSALKDAREAIKNKEFGAAIKLCKSILKSDKENYMALVFFGISLQEVGPRDQAPHAFRKAILSNAEQPLAWHGLANYYDKDESNEANKELITVYEKLLHIESDASKFSDLCGKLVARTLKIKEVVKSAEILKKLASDEKINENNRRTAWLALASLLSQLTDLTHELMLLNEITLSTVVKERSSVTCDYYKEYLKLLYKLKKYEVLFDEAINMNSVYESNIYPLEWICKLYVELTIEDNPIVDKFEDRIEKYYEKLLNLQSDAVMGFFTKGVKLFRNGDYMSSRDLLTKVISIRSGLMHAWVLLSECWLKLYCYNEAVQTAIRADKLMQSVTKENVNLRKKLDKILIRALSKHDDPEKWKMAMELCEKILSQNEEDSETICSLITVYINLEKYDDAQKLLSKLTTNNCVNAVLLNAKLLRKQGNLREALNLLKDITDSCESFVESGTLYLELEEYDKCLMPFLKAAKIDPNYYMCFVYLGRYYEYNKDMDKARRCYQKAFRINPRCSEAGIGLSNIYREQQNWAANLELLQSITGRDNSGGLPMISADVRWAWLQLGLHYLEQSDYGSAIDCLRSVIRVEPDNGHYWECLADAYMARGSYTAALKSYERAAELSADILYPKLQVASIKLLLGHYAEAKFEFQSLLLENRHYVPALKGLAENCLNLAFTQRKEQLLGLCRTNAQCALDHLTPALKERGDLSCLWKLTGDSCSLVASLPDKYNYMLVQSLLAEGKEKDDEVILSKEQLYTLAARCYCKAINLSQTNMLLWHDLALCYYSHGCCTEDRQDSRRLLDRALATAKYCVTNNPSYWHHWNLLGLIAVHKDIKQYSLAQHAFIKAVTVDHNSTMSWCNLGTLYLMLGDIQLANKAYSQAQRADPGYVNSWIGQALIAEMMGHEDAMDLFRHSTQLGFQPQGALGYANWVCRTIIEAPTHAVIYSIHNMHAVPVASDALTWFTVNDPYNACAWNMLGLLQERLGLKLSATNAFNKSLKLVNEANHDKVLVNYGRMFVKQKLYEKAIEMYKQVKEASFNGGCGLALAQFKAQHYEESYDSYDTTMQWLAESENLKSHVMVALAAMAYMFQGPDGAKTLLFQSTQAKPPSQWGLYATLALGLLHGDINLAQLVLKELQSMKDEPEIIFHYSILQAYIYLLQDDKKNAVKSLCKQVHRHPGQASLWLSLAVLLLQLDLKNMSQAAGKCAQVSMKMGRSQMDVTKVLCIATLASLQSKDTSKALKSAQRAVHCYPDVAEGWAVLISTLTSLHTSRLNWSRKCEWLQSAVDHLQQNLNPSQKLTAWLSHVKAH